MSVAAVVAGLVQWTAMGSSICGSREAPRSGLKRIPYPWVIVGLVIAAKMAGAAPNFGLPMLYPFMQEEWA